MDEKQKREYLLGFANKNEILDQIYFLGFDYDGWRNDIEGLRNLIDEIVELAEYGSTLQE